MQHQLRCLTLKLFVQGTLSINFDWKRALLAVIRTVLVALTCVPLIIFCYKKILSDQILFHSGQKNLYLWLKILLLKTILLAFWQIRKHTILHKVVYLKLKIHETIYCYVNVVYLVRSWILQRINLSQSTFIFFYDILSHQKKHYEII